MYRWTRGRINRATYWLFLAILVAGIVALVEITGRPAPFALILLVALCTPRLHDIGRSGWWAGGVVIAFLVVEFGAPAAMAENAGVVKGLYDLLMMSGMIVLGIRRGRTGPNRYGPQPAPGISFEQFKDGAGQQT